MAQISAQPTMSFPCKPIPIPANADFGRLSIEVPGTKTKGQTAHYRNSFWPELVTPYNQPISTCQKAWDSGLTLSRNQPCLGHRKVVSTKPLKFDDKYTWLTFQEVETRRRALGATLYNWFQSGKLVRAEGGYECVGIWSANRPEWQIIDLAIQGYGQVSVSLYDTLGPDSVSYIINHASLSIIFTAPDKIPGLLKIAHTLKDLKVIVSIDPLGDTVRPLLSSWAADKNIEIYEMSELIAAGEKNPRDIIPAKPDQMLTICYTSGTTGNPKGALITHGAMATAVVAQLYAGHHTPGGALLSYLPLAHIYARFAELLCLSMGNPIGYFSGDNLRLLEDAQILKPIYFPSVPRVLNRVYASASMALLGGGVKGALLQRAIDAKSKNLKENGSTSHFLWDRLVFAKIRALLGGNVKVLTSGSAPIASEVLDFLKIAFGCDVMEGYGMTENCGTCTTNYAVDHNGGGTVGPPKPVNEVKLIDVPAMGYTSEDKPYPRGELCTRGTNHFVGYYKDEANTKKTIDADGWCHTGDVAAIDYAGRVAIIDRVKNIMKLSQGEYVALEKIENIYSTVSLLQTCFVYGDSLRDHLVAVVVPDPVAIIDMARRLNIPVTASDGKAAVEPTDRKALDQLIGDERVYKEILRSMNVEAKKAHLKGFETVKTIHITNEPFTAENGLLTATFKIKRKDAYENFKKELDALYANYAKSK